MQVRRSASNALFGHLQNVYFNLNNNSTTLHMRSEPLVVVKNRFCFIFIGTILSYLKQNLVSLLEVWLSMSKKKRIYIFLIIFAIKSNILQFLPPLVSTTKCFDCFIRITAYCAEQIGELRQPEKIKKTWLVLKQTENHLKLFIFDTGITTLNALFCR